MSYRVLITESARSQVITQAPYIAEISQSLAIAQRWLQKVYDAADTLARFPHRCALAQENDFRDYEIRRLLVDDYLLLFTILEKQRNVVVIGFRHGSRLPQPAELPKRKPTDLDQATD